MGAPEGFGYSASKAGVVTFTHHGRPAGTLRGQRAAKFLAFVEGLDLECEQDAEALQHQIARLTGNYKRGNERAGRRGRQGEPGTTGQ
jgi:hypothetical protein